MSPLKYSQTAWGTWDRDENNLPCFTVDPAAVPAWSPPLCHRLGCGTLSVAVDHFGRTRLWLPDVLRPRLVSVPSDSRNGGLYLTLVTPERTCSLLAGELRGEHQPQVTFGVGYARFEGELSLSDQLTVAFELLLTVAPAEGAPLLIQTALRHLRGPSQECTLQVTLEVGPVTPPPVTCTAPPPNFCRDGIAMFTDVGGGLGDLFLAGGPDWDGGCARNRLQLTRLLRIATGAPTLVTLLAGLRADCSLGLLQRLLRETDPAASRAAWAAALNQHQPRVPELWMQDELLWNAGILLASRACEGQEHRPVLGTTSCLPAADAPPGGADVRDLLLLSFAARERAPHLARATLEAVAAAQGRSGRLPERLGQVPEARVVPHLHRSDLEIWFLLAWAEFVTDSPDADLLLDTPLRFADGTREPLRAHLRAAFRFLRDEIGMGAHGHIRILAGDTASFLSACGREGRGESVLNSALAVCALTRLAPLARRRRDTLLADELDHWAEDLRAAVGRAFDHNWFGRAYTDAGRLVGGLDRGVLFVDVQAWAALAACGTARQRETALQRALEDARTDAGLACLTPPFAPPGPADVTDDTLPTGEGGNGGVSVAVAAWFLWALAQQGHRDLAIAEWERCSVRHRAHQFPHVPATLHWSLAAFASGYAGARGGGPGRCTWPPPWSLPAAPAVAWLEFALRRIAAG